MAVTRINNNQISDASAGNAYVGINAATKVQPYSITATKLANNLTYGSDFTVTGNLTVQGNTTAIDTTYTTIEDPILLLASNQTGSPTVDIGFIGERGTSDNIAFVWDESAGEFVTVYTTTGETNTTVSIASYADLHTGNANIGGNLTVTGTTTYTGNVIGNLNVSGNIASGNILTPGLINATGTITSSANVQGANLVASANVVSVGAAISGNITGGNLLTGGLVSATGTITSSANISGANVVASANVVSVGAAISGNITGGNLLTGGLVSATGNVTSNANINGANVNATSGVTAGTTVIATGNVTGGNLTTAGKVTATGNIDSSANISGGNLAVTGTVTSATIETTGNAVVGGNLIVQGNITYQNVEDLRIQDPVIIMGTGPNGAPLTTPDSYDRGTFMEYYTSARGNAWMGWQNSSGNMIAAADVSFSGNDIIAVNSYGTFQAGNLYIQSAVSTGNVTGGNLNTGGLVSATGNITSSANIAGGNAIITSNINGGNLNVTTGVRASTGYFTGNVDVLGNLNASVGIVYANSGIFYGDAVTGNGAAYAGVPGFTPLGSNVVMQFGGNVNAYSQLNFQNINSGTSASTDYIATADNGSDTTYYIDVGINSSTFNDPVGYPGFGPNDSYVHNHGGNLILNPESSGKAINFMVGGTDTTDVIGYVNASGLSVTGNISATTAVIGGNITIQGSNVNSNAARITINSDSSDVDFAINSDTTANVFYVDAGTGTVSVGSSTQTTNVIFAMNATNSFLMPVGNTAQRPGVGVTGMLRFNSTLDAVEVYDTDSWTTVGTPTFTVISDEQFNGDGSTVAFTLSEATTTASTIVSINGIVQIPTIAYSVGGGGNDTLTFTEAPETGDIIDVRILTTTTQVTSISNSPGTAVVATNPTIGNVEVTGNLVVAGAVSATSYIGLDAASIANGTSSVTVIAADGNIRANVGGATIINITSSGIENGQANGTGNIGSASSYFNTVFAQATSAQYADLAEIYAADAGYEPGTVLSFGGEAEVTISTVAGDTRIAGVVSTNPSYVMNATLDSEHTATVALTGRVPTLVSGPVAKGDMMVSSGNGRAVACATPSMGSVIGKALENHPGGDGVIEVVVGRL